MKSQGNYFERYSMSQHTTRTFFDRTSYSNLSHSSRLKIACCAILVKIHSRSDIIASQQSGALENKSRNSERCLIVSISLYTAVQLHHAMSPDAGQCTRAMHDWNKLMGV